MTNFFGWIEAGQVFEENTRFEEVLQNLQHVFRTELVKERIADNMNRLVRLEKNPLLRAVPLEIKKPVFAGWNDAWREKYFRDLFQYRKNPASGCV